MVNSTVLVWRIWTNLTDSFVSSKYNWVSFHHILMYSFILSLYVNKSLNETVCYIKWLCLFRRLNWAIQMYSFLKLKALGQLQVGFNGGAEICQVS